MKLLKNKRVLNVYQVLHNGQTIFLEVPEYSSMEFISKSKSYHAYYEMYTFKLKCIFDNKNINFSCSMYKGAKEPKVDCVKDNLFKHKTILWSEVFDECFP